MIKDPQIFIVYEPGLMGTFFSNLFLFQESLVNDSIRNMEWGGNSFSKYNVHRTKFKEPIKDLHRRPDFLRVQEQDLPAFFSPLQGKGLRIHKLASWHFLTTDWSKYFANYVLGVLSPSAANVEHWAKRSIETNEETETVKSEWWYKNVKNFDKLPKEFVDKMRLKERKKYLRTNYQILQNTKESQRIVHFNLDNVARDPIQKFCDQCCDAVGMTQFEVPADVISQFIERNSIFLTAQKNAVDNSSTHAI